MFFFFNDTATTEIYTLSLHDALPISRREMAALGRAAVMQKLRERALGPTLRRRVDFARVRAHADGNGDALGRSEEHTSELQSRLHLVCRLLLEKKKNRWYDAHPLTRL